MRLLEKTFGVEKFDAVIIYSTLIQTYNDNDYSPYVG